MVNLHKHNRPYEKNSNWVMLANLEIKTYPIFHKLPVQLNGKCMV